MSTVRELAVIARDVRKWVSHPQPNVTEDYRRKIDLLSQAVIEYEVLLNSYAPELVDEGMA